MSKAILDNPLFSSERPPLERRKAVILVEVELDPVPGAMHTADDAAKQVAHCLESIKQYNPKTKLLVEGS